ncbi:MAG: Hint domain-containing protein [Archangium sp.]|nr:Hint domain-containing protein [Archangium sp.]
MKTPLVALLGSLSLAACCIARGTLVSTPRGRRPVEDLIEQDTVWSVDPATGERFASHVVAIARATREVMRLTGEGFSLTCTTDHPLYDPTAKSWSPAGDWVLGTRSDLLLVTDDGAPPRVVTVHTREVSAGLAEVTDLTVEHELHDFVAGGVLVHNKSPVRHSCVVVSGGAPTSLRDMGPCVRPDGGEGFVTCDASPNPSDAGTCDE